MKGWWLIGTKDVSGRGLKRVSSMNGATSFGPRTIPTVSISDFTAGSVPHPDGTSTSKTLSWTRLRFRSDTCPHGPSVTTSVPAVADDDRVTSTTETPWFYVSDPESLELVKSVLSRPTF